MREHKSAYLRKLHVTEWLRLWKDIFISISCLQVEANSLLHLNNPVEMQDTYKPKAGLCDS